MKGSIVAKKKASAKKPISKKVVKKTISKKAPKKVVKKSAPAKKAKAKKPPMKKSAPKTASKAAKKPVKKVAAKASKKAVPKKAVAKAPAKKAVAKKTTAPKAVVTNKPAVSAKSLDLSGFVTPLDDRLIVQLSGAEKMTAGGLYIPDTVSDVSGNLQGQVVAVGRGHQGKKGHLRPMDVKVGDKVVFAEHAGSPIKIKNEDLIILREVDVMGVVSK